MKSRSRSALRFGVLAALAFVMQIVGPISGFQGKAERQPRTKIPSRLLIPGTSDVQLIVELDSPSVVEYLRGERVSGRVPLTQDRPRLNLQSADATQHRSRLAREQQQFSERIAALAGAEVRHATDMVMNAVTVRVRAEDYDAVRNLPGVRKVYFSHTKRMTMDAAATVVNAPALWARAGGKTQAGRGIKIGIIDSGIDITNPMFIDSSLTAPPGFPKGESSYTNSKVIVARNYMNLLSHAQPVRTAIDEVGHGSFVAGVAAGKEVVAPAATISGIAPGAYLGNYKVFGTPGINDTTRDEAVLAAIDDAVADGMDVLNLSLGALDYVPPDEDPEVKAIRAAIASGVVVTISAGNEGPETHTIGSPGTTPEAITVGSVSNSRTLGPTIHVTAPAPVPSNLATLGYVNGSGPTIAFDRAAQAIADVSTLDGNGFGCSSFASGILTGKIAFMQRGGTPTPCTFLVKVSNASAAGATAVVIYNNNPTEGAIAMSRLEGSSIPAVMISNKDGLVLLSYIKGNPGAVQVAMDRSSAIVPIPATPRILSSFGSVGPDMDFSLKPDLVAVGENVYSAAGTNNSSGALYDPTKFTMSSGTSFSAPMVAGAAAAIKQLFPGLGQLAIKSILTNTASQAVTVDGTNPADLLQTGGGLLDLDAASSAVATFSPSILSFGVQAYRDSISLTRTLTVSNVSSKTDQYSFSVSPLIPGLSVSLSQTSTGSIPPGGTASVDVKILATAPVSRGFQGFVLVQSSNGSAPYRVPYWAGLYTLDSSRILTVAQQGGTYANLASALRAARPGNIIEIADSGTYTTGLLLSTGDEGLPLNGITIRAKAGQTPILDASGASLYTPNLQFVGLQNVALQGLTIKGGYFGVEVTRPAVGIPVSLTVDRCTITNQSGDSYASGLEVDSGGTLNVLQSTIQNSSGTGIEVWGGTQLTVLGSTLTGNTNDAIDINSSNADILNSSITGNLGAGIYAQTSSGTIDGNTISGCTGNFGDAIEVGDGNLTITNNLLDANDQAGVWLYAAARGSTGPTVRIAGNTIRGNADGGIVANPVLNATIEGNIIKDNARGVRLAGASVATLLNNVIVRSTDASVGDGLQVTGTAAAQVINNTIYKNRLTGINLTSPATVAVYNTIITKNTAGQVTGVTADKVQNSLVGDGPAAFGNNIYGDPKFTNPDADDFSLSSGSPAIDAGSDSAPGLPFLDYNRQLRVVSSNALPGEGKVDLGAFETGSAYPLVFPVIANGTQAVLGDTFTTGYATYNPSSSSALTNYTGYAPAGTLIPGTSNPSIQTLAAGSQVPVLGFQMFGFPQSSGVFGSVLASSARSLAGFFLMFDSGFSRFSVGANASDQTGTDLWFLRHQFDSTGKGRYVVFNPGVNSATVTATLRSSDGNQLDSPKTATIAAKGQYVFAFDSVTASAGSVRIQSDRPVSGLEILSNASGYAALNAVPAGSEARLFFPHVAINGGFTSMIGVVNGGNSIATVLLTAYDASGQVLGTPKSVSLGAGSQLLQSADSLFGIGAGQLVTGYVIAESDQPQIQGFTQFTYSSGQNSSSAVVPADSTPRGKLLFSHVAHQVSAGAAGTYQTGIALLNPFGVPVDYVLRVYDAAGTKIAERTDTLAPGQKIAKILSHPVAGAGFFTQALPLASGHVEVETVQKNYALFGFELFFTETFSQLASVPAQTVR
jgi:minor extracellular serine protease Vpr